MGCCDGRTTTVLLVPSILYRYSANPLAAPRAGRGMTMTDNLANDQQHQLVPPQEEGGVETEDVGGVDIIREPFDPTLIRVETKTLTVDLLVARIKEEE